MTPFRFEQRFRWPVHEVLLVGMGMVALPLPVDAPAGNHCGTCRACIDVCPTEAIVAPYELDARLCISYLTIELKGSIAEPLRPLIGNRIYGFWGNLIDVLSVLATLVGLATSLGLGVKQINAGLGFLFGIQIDVATQVTLIAVITGFATLSVMAGLDAGVKRLSQANMIMAALFMLFLLLVAPDVAMTEAAIGSGLTTFLFFFVLGRVRGQHDD